MRPPAPWPCVGQIWGGSPNTLLLKVKASNESVLLRWEVLRFTPCLISFLRGKMWFLPWKFGADGPSLSTVTSEHKSCCNSYSFLETQWDTDIDVYIHQICKINALQTMDKTQIEDLLVMYICKHKISLSVTWAALYVIHGALGGFLPLRTRLKLCKVPAEISQRRNQMSIAGQQKLMSPSHRIVWSYTNHILNWNQ